MLKQPIFILTGTPASGKSTVARALLNRFSYGFHIPVDTLRNMVASGLSDPIGSWDEETARQFGLARDGAAQLAQVYARAGFAVAIDDVIFPPDVAHHYDGALAQFDVYKVMLRPKVKAAQARNAARQLDIDNALLEGIIRPIYEHFATFDLPRLAEKDWCILDTIHDSVAETVDRILSETNCFPK
ncbi:MAG: AAA family ATPase [Chloroflexota bacterium]